MKSRNRGSDVQADKRRGNGHLSMTDPRTLESFFNQQQFPNVLKEFVHPGKDPGELLMRCIFKDERERNAAVLYLAKCREFGLVKEEQVLLHWLASTTAVRGIARRELLMAFSGIVAPSLYDKTDKRAARRFGKKEETEQSE
jgi:hypothetical protein